MANTYLTRTETGTAQIKQNLLILLGLKEVNWVLTKNFL